MSTQTWTLKLKQEESGLELAIDTALDIAEDKGPLTIPIRRDFYTHTIPHDLDASYHLVLEYTLAGQEKKDTFKGQFVTAQNIDGPEEGSFTIPEGATDIRINNNSNGHVPSVQIRSIGKGTVITEIPRGGTLEASDPAYFRASFCEDPEILVLIGSRR